MEFISSLFGGVASAATGGLVGVLGSLIGVGVRYFEDRQKHKQRMEVMEQERELMKLRMEADAQRTDLDIKLSSSQGAWNGLQASHKADALLSQSSSRWANNLRSLFRPFLTIALVAVIYFIFRDLLGVIQSADTLLGQFLDSADASEMLRYIVYSLVFAGSTSIAWWFGERSFLPPGNKAR